MSAPVPPAPSLAADSIFISNAVRRAGLGNRDISCRIDTFCVEIHLIPRQREEECGCGPWNEQDAGQWSPPCGISGDAVFHIPAAGSSLLAAEHSHSIYY